MFLYKLVTASIELVDNSNS